jgi:hypothetical protein
MEGGDERCFWQIAHLLFIVFFPPSLFLISSVLLFFKLIPNVCEEYACTYARTVFCVRSRGLFNTIVMECRRKGALACARVGLTVESSRSNHHHDHHHACIPVS